jgi:hypothetical protein
VKGSATRFEFLTGITLKNLARLLMRERFDVDREHWMDLRNIAGVAVLSSMFGLFERRMRVNARRSCPPPLFVLGHWRSGTTHVHRLLSADPRHTAPSAYQCAFPECFVVGESFLKPRMAADFPERRPFDNVHLGVDDPFEDEFALVKTTLISPLLSAVFPRSKSKYIGHESLRSLHAIDRAKWKRSLQQFVSKIEQATGKRVVLKSPAHTFRIAAILEVFPDARFVVVVRDPYAVFASMRKMTRSLHEHNTFQEGLPTDIDDFVLGRGARMHAALMRSRDLVREHRIVTVKFEDIEASPVAALERVYDALGLGMFEGVRQSVEKYLDSSGAYRKNLHQLSVLERARVREVWGDIFEEYGYEA